MSVYSEVKPKNHARRNPFPLGNGFKYNTKVGMILPLKFFPTLPSSEYEFDLKALMRTQPLNTAAFSGFTFNYDVVWTPNNDHYSSFNQFIAQRLNKQHTTQPDIQQIPHFDKGAFVRLVISLAVYESLAAECPWSVLDNLHSDQDIEITYPRFLLWSRHMPEEAISLTCIRSLDLLEYGNYLPLVKSLVAAAKRFLDKDVVYPTPGSGGYPADAIDPKTLPYCVRFLRCVKLFSTSSPITAFGDMRGTRFDLTFDEYLAAIDRMLWADSPSALFYKYGPVAKNYVPLNKFETLWPVMCYNKAFWQFYRNEYYDIDYNYYYSSETQNYSNTIEYVQLFNMDDISTSIIPSYDTMSDVSWRLLCMFAVKPHQYKKDLFTGVLPSTQYGNVSVMSADDMFRKLIGDTMSTNTVLPGEVYSYGSTDNISIYQRQNTQARGTLNNKFKFDPAVAISVLELRRADAMQRFNERMLRAGNRTKDIFVAHGWEEPLSEKTFEARFCGSYDGRLDLNVVASTSQNESVDLGQLAANGISIINGRTIRLKSHDFGTLLVVAYIVKDAEYDAYGVHKSHSLIEPFDFPYPELQNVSLAPITKDQLTDMGNNASTVLGFLPQNMAYKTQSDLLHGEFYSADIFGSSYTKERPIGIFSNMVSGRKDIQEGSQALSFFYVQPSCADNIFVVNANSNQDTDQIFGAVRIDCNTVEPLDVIGLPI